MISRFFLLFLEDRAAKDIFDNVFVLLDATNTISGFALCFAICTGARDLSSSSSCIGLTLEFAIRTVDLGAKGIRVLPPLEGRAYEELGTLFSTELEL